ncbi:MAG: hypothetical protein AAB448_01565 [Patescibacteria group bacterium]
MKKLFLASLSLLALVGAGCVEGNTYEVDTTREEISVTTNTTTVTYAAPTCDDGTKLYQSAKHNIEFCYPETNGSDGTVTVADDKDGVVLSVDGEAMRKVWVVDVNSNMPREDVVEVYALDNVTTVTCGVMGVNDSVDGRHVYVIVGENMTGEQNIGSVTACTYNEADTNDGFDMNDQRSGMFYMYDRTPGTLFILTGEQDVSLGELTEKFTMSMQPKK